jgi:hypothetical protein
MDRSACREHITTNQRPRWMPDVGCGGRGRKPQADAPLMDEANSRRADGRPTAAEGRWNDGRGWMGKHRRGWMRKRQRRTDGAAMAVDECLSDGRGWIRERRAYMNATDPCMNAEMTAADGRGRQPQADRTESRRGNAETTVADR